MSTWPATLTAVVDEGGGVNRMDFLDFLDLLDFLDVCGDVSAFRNYLGDFCVVLVSSSRGSSNLVSYLSQSLIEHNSN